MEKLQEILKWLSDQDNYYIDDLYGLLIDEDNYYIENVIGKNRYQELELEIIEDYNRRKEE